MKILVLQHLAVEHPGIFRDFWREDGHEWHVVALDEGALIPPLEDYDMLAVMGGPQDVWQEDAFPWLVAEKAAIRRWVLELERPYLGMCLGHQLLAEALGGKVTLMDAAEVGLTEVGFTPEGRSDPLFAGIGDSMLTLQWHGAGISPCRPVPWFWRPMPPVRCRPCAMENMHMACSITSRSPPARLPTGRLLQNTRPALRRRWGLKAQKA